MTDQAVKALKEAVEAVAVCKAIPAALVTEDDYREAGAACYLLVSRHRDELLAALEGQLDMLLWCPQCLEQHIDAPEPENGWTNPPHKSHLCHFCGCIWRPANHPTNGVASIERGDKDTHGAKPKCFATEQDFNDAVRGALEGQRWRPMTEAPEVNPGQQEYVSALLQRGGKRLVQPVVVCNQMELYYEAAEGESSGPFWSMRVVDDGDWYNARVTGWYEIGADSEYDWSYSPVCKDGWELIGWQPLPAPSQEET